jgi:hypothetical protein
MTSLRTVRALDDGAIETRAAPGYDRVMTVVITPRRSPLAWFRARWALTDDFGVALLLIMLSIADMATIGDSGAGRVSAVFIAGATVIFVLHTCVAKPRLVRASTMVLGVAVCFAVLDTVSGESHERSVEAAASAFMAFVAPVVIARRLISHRTVTLSTLIGAICLYLLIGVFFAYLFAAVDDNTVLQFFVQIANPTPGDFLYFSFVSLTTLGFGDLSPATALGRTLTVSEALAGQLYLVSTVALLVGNLGRSRHDLGDAEAQQLLARYAPPSDPDER